MENKKLLYSEKDVEIIKSVFSENDELLVVLRKLFFGAELDKQEKDLIKNTFKNKEIIEVVRRKVYGENNFNSQIGQLSDFWIGAEEQIVNAPEFTIRQIILAKKETLRMFRQGFKLLENIDGERVDVIEYDPDSDDDYGTKLISRNGYMKAIETALLAMKVIAGTKDETLEQTMKRITKNSSR